MSPRPAALCAGPGGMHLASDLQAATGLPAIGVSSRTFGDGEVWVRVDGDVGGRDLVIVQGTHAPQDSHLQQLYQLVDAARAAGARRVLCVVPYLAYGRQDRRTTPGEPASSAIVLRTLAMLGADGVVCVEAHNPAVLAEAPIDAVSVGVAAQFARWVAASGLDGPVILSPDAGGAGRAAAVARPLDCPWVACRKLKDESGETWYDELPPGLRGRQVVVVDDVWTSGTTLRPLHRRLVEEGVAGVTCLVAHLFPAVQAGCREWGLPVSLVGTTTIPGPPPRLPVTAGLAGPVARWLRAPAGEPRVIDCP